MQNLSSEDVGLLKASLTAIENILMSNEELWTDSSSEKPPYITEVSQSKIEGLQQHKDDEICRLVERILQKFSYEAKSY